MIRTPSNLEWRLILDFGDNRFRFDSASDTPPVRVKAVASGEYVEIALSDSQLIHRWYGLLGEMVPARPIEVGCRKRSAFNWLAKLTPAYRIADYSHPRLDRPVSFVRARDVLTHLASVRVDNYALLEGPHAELLPRR